MADDPFIDILQQWTEVSMHLSMRNFLRYARQSELSMSQFGVLFQLSRKKSCGVTDLSDHLGVTSAAVSQLLEGMVQQGLILRKEDPNDRRTKQIALTEKGYLVLEKGIHARQDWLVNLAESLSADEKEQVSAALSLLVGKIRQPVHPIKVIE